MCNWTSSGRLYSCTSLNRRTSSFTSQLRRTLRYGFPHLVTHFLSPLLPQARTDQVHNFRLAYKLSSFDLRVSSNITISHFDLTERTSMWHLQFYYESRRWCIGTPANLRSTLISEMLHAIPTRLISTWLFNFRRQGTDLIWGLSSMCPSIIGNIAFDCNSFHHYQHIRMIRFMLVEITVYSYSLRSVDYQSVLYLFQGKD